MLTIALTVVWMGILRDSQIALMVLLLLGAVGIGISVMAIAVGVGLLGFGICSVCEWAVGWLCRASQWPDE